MYLLGPNKPYISDNTTYYYYILEKDGNRRQILQIVDDKNIPGDSLGKRRLGLLKERVKLSKIGMAIFFLGDLIKIAKPNLWFIDNNGTVFNYQKSSRVKLTFKKITKKIPIQSGGMLLEVEGMPGRFKTLYTPLPEETYAGLLMLKGTMPILYGVYSNKFKDTWRLV